MEGLLSTGPTPSSFFNWLLSAGAEGLSGNRSFSEIILNWTYLSFIPSVIYVMPKNLFITRYVLWTFISITQVCCYLATVNFMCYPDGETDNIEDIFAQWSWRLSLIYQLRSLVSLTRNIHRHNQIHINWASSFTGYLFLCDI